MGRANATATDCVPGNAESRSRTEFVNARMSRSFGYFTEGSDTSNDRTRSGRKRIHAQQIREAANEQPGTDEENDGERHLGDHQRASRPLRASFAARTAHRFLEHLPELGAHGVNGRNEAKDNARQQREAGAKEQHASVDGDVVETRESARTEGDDRVDRP